MIDSIPLCLSAHAIRRLTMAQKMRNEIWQFRRLVEDGMCTKRQASRAIL